MSKYDELKNRAKAATPGPWDWGGTPVATAEEALEICRVNIELTANPDPYFCEVYVEDGRRTALVGNGPTGQQNAAFIASANPAAILDLIAENERLAATNEQITAALYDQIEITHQHRLESDGLKAERDQMRELLMRLVDLQNSGRGPIRSYELWNDLVNEARPLLGLEVRHV